MQRGPSKFLIISIGRRPFIHDEIEPVVSVDRANYNCLRGSKMPLKGS